MRDQRTDIAALSYGQLAVALAASSLPTAGRRVSEAEAALYASEGLALLGLEAVQALSERAQRLGQVIADSPRQSAAVDQALTAHPRLFGGRRRCDRAHSTADTLLRARRAARRDETPAAGQLPEQRSFVTGSGPAFASAGAR